MEGDSECALRLGQGIEGAVTLFCGGRGEGTWADAITCGRETSEPFAAPARVREPNYVADGFNAATNFWMGNDGSGSNDCVVQRAAGRERVWCVGERQHAIYRAPFTDDVRGSRVSRLLVYLEVAIVNYFPYSKKQASCGQRPSPRGHACKQGPP